MVVGSGTLLVCVPWCGAMTRNGPYTSMCNVAWHGARKEDVVALRESHGDVVSPPTLWDCRHLCRHIH